jgi:hypothetical protein
MGEKELPERLVLTQNAQFYVPRNDVDDALMNAIFEAAVENMDINSEFEIDVFREERSIESYDFTYTYSIKVFPSVRPVYFIKDELEDRVFAFILVIEYQNHIAILKKSCANISDLLKEHFIVIDNRDLTATFDDNEVEFQKISLRNMTISDRALRARSYEAADLKGLLSTHSAGRSIPYYLKIRQGSSLKTISTGTGRVVESSQRKSLDDIAIWVKKQIELIQNPNENNKFLDSFAKRVELEDVLLAAEPNAILIESHSLYDRIERDGLAIKYKTKKNKIVTVSNRVKNKLFIALEDVYELDQDLKVIGRESCSKLRKNEKTLTITSKALTKFRIVENGKDVTLQKYIIKHGFYSVTFTDPKYMYFMGACFEDSSGIAELDSLLELLHPFAEISSVTSEKGQFSEESTKFDIDSMFGIVEEIHKDDDYIFCDDLGIEWADHISFKKEDSCINFIHSKHGKVSTSASNLHDVVGQGIKNLGHMYFTKEQMIERVFGKFSETYTNGHVSTNIGRIRKGNIVDID